MLSSYAAVTSLSTPWSWGDVRKKYQFTIAINHTMDAVMAIFRSRWTSRVDGMLELPTARRGSQGATVVATSLWFAT